MSNKSSRTTPLEVPANFTPEQAQTILNAADQLNQWQKQGPLLTQISLLEVWVVYLSTPQGERLNQHDEETVYVDMMHTLRLVKSCQPAA